MIIINNLLPIVFSDNYLFYIYFNNDIADYIIIKIKFDYNHYYTLHYIKLLKMKIIFRK